MKSILKFIGLVAILITGLTACGGASLSPNSNNNTSGSGLASTPGELFNTTSNPLNLVQMKAAKVSSLPPQSGAAYYIPLNNTSSSAFTVSSASATNPTVWAVDASACTSVQPQGNCTVAVGFNAGVVESASQLNTVITLTYANGSTSSFPLTGAVVESGSVSIQMPSTIVPNASGTAYGVITLFNGESVTYNITTSSIAATSQPGVSWTFTPNCDGSGSTSVAPNSSCSIAFVYQVNVAVAESTSTPIAVSVPLQNQTTSQTVIQQPTTTVTPPQTTVAPYVTYGGGSVSLASGPASFVLQNSGNGTLSGLTVTPPTGVTQSNNCSNIAAGAICTVTLTGTPTSGNTLTVVSDSPTINIAVYGQALAISPVTYSYGTSIYSGTVLSKSFTVSNLGPTALTNVTGAFANSIGSSFSVASSTTCPSGSFTANPFISCYVNVVYTAPYANTSQTGTLTVTADGQSQVQSTFTAGSTISPWTSFFTNLSGYTESGEIVLALANDAESNFYFSTSMPSGVAGPRNVWFESYTIPSTVYNLTANYAGYESSAATSLLVIPMMAGNGLITGNYTGSIQMCPVDIVSGTCTTLYTGNGTLGVTSLVGVSNSGFAGYSDKTSGTTGQLLFTQSGSFIPVSPAVTGAVGKMATDGTFVYAPIHNANSTGILSTYESSGALVASNIAPSGTNGLSSGEFITVVYYGNSTLYVGTSMGNVYSSTTVPATTASWNKITSSVALSTSSYISALALDNTNNLFAGLVNLSSPTTGGGIFELVNGTSSFVAATGYSDQSSVSTILFTSGMINVATYAGNIWQTR